MENQETHIENETEYQEQVVTPITMGKIKETSITLNTLDLGKATATTETINGFVECLIVNSDKPFRLLVQLEEYPGIELFNTQGDNIVGHRYYSLRTHTMSNKNEKFNFTDACWAVNNKFRCTIEGGLNTIVQIVIRYT